MQRVMQVTKYIPDRLYGFVSDPETGQEAFFHLGDFDPKSYREAPPPPILGEAVLVTMPAEETRQRTGSPRVARAERIQEPILVTGKVEDFNPLSGYGFVRGVDGISYHLHRSEMLDGHFPMPGTTLQFYAGMRQGRPRACHVKVI